MIKPFMFCIRMHKNLSPGELKTIWAAIESVLGPDVVEEGSRQYWFIRNWRVDNVFEMEDAKVKAKAALTAMGINPRVIVSVKPVGNGRSACCWRKGAQ